MELWADYRVQKLHAPFTRARYGDLYSGCFLSRFMDTSDNIKLKEYRALRNNIDLYIMHDSYLANQLKKENFIGVDSLVLSDLRNKKGVYFKLRKDKENILIIECSERTAEWRLGDSALAFTKFYTTNRLQEVKKVKEPKDKLIKYFFNPFIEQNLEFNLFDYEVFKPVKELKAGLNFYWFNKLPKDVAVSSDKEYLLLPETVNPWKQESSFRGISDNELDKIAVQMKQIKKHYRKLGFKKIFFAVVPNPASIIDQKRMRYNYKIGRIIGRYGTPDDFIDVFKIFEHARKRIYRRDDSHWNRNGIQLWINEVNKKISSL
ncbi:MAG TPA: hypothetical protein VNY73_09905 [Bacteroidia bacterium]|jgi:hypothetical protein|nr:hypothetical protein [Bacteroidia bacterium]